MKPDRHRRDTRRTRNLLVVSSVRARLASMHDSQALAVDAANFGVLRGLACNVEDVEENILNVLP